MTLDREPDEETHSGRYCEHHQRPVLHLIGQAPQRLVSELCCLAADKGPIPAEPVGHATQCRRDCFTNTLGRKSSIRRAAAADALQAALKGAQASIDFTEIRGDCGRRMAKHLHSPSLIINFNLSGDQ
jgi:hypothetical protein